MPCLGDFQIVCNLKIEPEFRCGIEKPCQTKRCVNTHATFFPYQIIHPWRRNAQADRQSIGWTDEDIERFVSLLRFRAEVVDILLIKHLGEKRYPRKTGS